MSKALQYMKDMVNTQWQRIQGKEQKSFGPKSDDIFAGITKNQLLDEAKCFNDNQLNDNKCRIILSRLIYILNKVLSLYHFKLKFYRVNY